MILTEKLISRGNKGSCDGVVMLSSIPANMAVLLIFSVSFDSLTDETKPST